MILCKWNFLQWDMKCTAITWCWACFTAAWTSSVFLQRPIRTVKAAEVSNAGEAVACLCSINLVHMRFCVMTAYDLVMKDYVSLLQHQLLIFLTQLQLLSPLSNPQPLSMHTASLPSKGRGFHSFRWGWVEAVFAKPHIPREGSIAVKRTEGILTVCTGGMCSAPSLCSAVGG